MATSISAALVGTGGRSAYRVFVANLPWTVATQELRDFGSSFGQVTHATVVFDRSTGMSKGYGFLSFATKDGYDALTKPGTTTHFMEGNFVNCSPSNDRQ